MYEDVFGWGCINVFIIDFRVFGFEFIGRRNKKMIVFVLI